MSKPFSKSRVFFWPWYLLAIFLPTICPPDWESRPVPAWAGPPGPSGQSLGHHTGQTCSTQGNISVTWVFHECYMSVTWVLHESYMSVKWVFHEYYIRVTQVLHDYYMIVTWVLDECYMSVMQVLYECYRTNMLCTGMGEGGSEWVLRKFYLSSPCVSITWVINMCLLSELSMCVYYLSYPCVTITWVFHVCLLPEFSICVYYLSYQCLYITWVIYVCL